MPGPQLAAPATASTTLHPVVRATARLRREDQKLQPKGETVTNESPRHKMCSGTPMITAIPEEIRFAHPKLALQGTVLALAPKLLLSVLGHHGLPGSLQALSQKPTGFKLWPSYLLWQLCCIIVTGCQASQHGLEPLGRMEDQIV